LFLNLTWDVDGGGWLKPHIVNGNQPAKVTTCGLMRRHCAAERSAQRHGHKAASIGWVWVRYQENWQASGKSTVMTPKLIVRGL